MYHTQDTCPTPLFCIPLVYNVEVVMYEYDLVDKINTFILFNYIWRNTCEFQELLHFVSKI